MTRLMHSQIITHFPGRTPGHFGREIDIIRIRGSGRDGPKRTIEPEAHSGLKAGHPPNPSINAFGTSRQKSTRHHRSGRVPGRLEASNGGPHLAQPRAWRLRRPLIACGRGGTACLEASTDSYPGRPCPRGRGLLELSSNHGDLRPGRQGRHETPSHGGQAHRERDRSQRHCLRIRAELNENISSAAQFGAPDECQAKPLVPGADILEVNRAALHQEKALAHARALAGPPPHTPPTVT